MSDRTGPDRPPPPNPPPRDPPPVSPGAVGSPDQVEQTLDDALADSCPASDPVSIVTSQHEEAWHKDREAQEEERRRREDDGESGAGQ